MNQKYHAELTFTQRRKGPFQPAIYLTQPLLGLVDLYLFIVPIATLEMAKISFPSVFVTSKVDEVCLDLPEKREKGCKQIQIASFFAELCSMYPLKNL